MNWELNDWGWVIFTAAPRILWLYLFIDFPFFVCESIKRDECARWVLPLSIADLNYRSNDSVDHVLKQSQTFVKKGVDLPSILLRGSNPPT